MSDLRVVVAPDGVVGLVGRAGEPRIAAHQVLDGHAACRVGILAIRPPRGTHTAAELTTWFLSLTAHPSMRRKLACLLTYYHGNRQHRHALQCWSVLQASLEFPY